MRKWDRERSLFTVRSLSQQQRKNTWTTTIKVGQKSIHNISPMTTKTALATLEILAGPLVSTPTIEAAKNRPIPLRNSN